MEITVHAPVACSDGPAGRISALIMNPQNDEITHIVVYETAALGTEREVPITLVANATPEQVKLTCTLAELHEQLPFIVYEFLSAKSEVDVELPDSTLFLSDSDPLAEVNKPIIYENLPPGEVALHRGTGVHASDGRVGRVDELAVGADGKITYLVLREGHLWGEKDIVVPVTYIDHANEDAVYLKLTKQEVAALPTAPMQRRPAATLPITP